MPVPTSACSSPGLVRPCSWSPSQLPAYIYPTRRGAASPHPVGALPEVSALAEAVSPCWCRHLAAVWCFPPLFSAFAANSLPWPNAESDPNRPAEIPVPAHSVCAPLCTQCTPLFSCVRPAQLSWRAERLPCSPAGVSVISAADQRHRVMQLGFPGRRRGALMPPPLLTRCCPPPPCILIGLSCGGAGGCEWSGVPLLPAVGTWVMLEKQPGLLVCLGQACVGTSRGWGWHGQGAATRSSGHGRRRGMVP